MSAAPAAADRPADAQIDVHGLTKRYGDLAQLTQAKGRFGVNADGALANNNKTI